MFGIFKKDPIKKKQKEYESLMEQAMHAQRNGKMDIYAELASKADKILKKIEDLKKENSK